MNVRLLDRQADADQQQFNAFCETNGLLIPIHLRPRACVFVAEQADRVWTGLLCARPAWLIEDFEIPGSGTIRLLTAEALLQYARGWGRGAGHDLAVFVVDSDNGRAREFLESRGAESEAALKGNKTGELYLMHL